MVSTDSEHTLGIGKVDRPADAQASLHEVDKAKIQDMWFGTLSNNRQGPRLIVGYFFFLRCSRRGRLATRCRCSIGVGVGCTSVSRRGGLSVLVRLAAKHDAKQKKVAGGWILRFLRYLGEVGRANLRAN